MTVPYLVSTAGYVSASNPGAATYLDVPLLNCQVGDIAMVWTWGFNWFSLNGAGSSPDTPTGWKREASAISVVGFNEVFSIKAQTNLSTVRLVAGAGQFLNGWFGYSWVVRGGEYPLAEFGPNTGFGTTGAFPALSSATNDNLCLHFMFSATDAIPAPGPALLDPNTTWTSNGIAVTPFWPWSLGAEVFTGTIPTPAFTPQTAFELNTPAEIDGTAWRLYSMLFEPLPEPPPPPPPRPAPTRLSLDCAETYTVWITDASYRNRLTQVAWAQLGWTRVLDEISAGSATLPDTADNARCCAELTGLEVWEHGLLIERNDIEVWSGPITAMARDPESRAIRITAADTLSRHLSNYVIWEDIAGFEGVVYTDVDAGEVFANIINIHARTAADTYVLECPIFNTNHLMSRTLYPRRLERTWTVLEEILESAVDMYVNNGMIHCWDAGRGWVYHNGRATVVLDGPYNSQYQMEYGQFTEESFTNLPSWAISGSEQANYISAPYADSGEKGFRTIYTAQDPVSIAKVGVLVFMDPNTLHRPDGTPPALNDSAFQLRADTLLALRHTPPAVLSGGVLAVGAPIDVENLRPGSIWRLDVHDNCFRQGLQAGRLKRVDVSVDMNNGSPVETIRPTVFPIGYEG